MAEEPSTELNDAAEAEAIVKIFGERNIPVTSAKGAIGHLIGAAGAAEAVASVLAMRDGLVPPTANPLLEELPLAAGHGPVKVPRRAPVWLK